MTNPQDTGTFDFWVTNRIAINIVHPKSGNTGDFEEWIWDRQYWQWYVKWPIRVPRYGFTNFQVPGIV